MALKIPAILAFLFVILTSQPAFACDDKSCENAYLASTYQYIKNYGRRGNAIQTTRTWYGSNYRRQQIAAVRERRAHARNRANRIFALNNHIHRLHSSNRQRQARLRSKR